MKADKKLDRFSAYQKHIGERKWRKRAYSGKTEKLTDHGKTVYITPREKKIVNMLKYSMMIGIPSTFVLAIFLHFICGIKIIEGAPTIQKWLKKKRKETPNS